MPYRIVAEECKGCDTCARVCPARASSGEKKQPHTIDVTRCIECGVCGRACPYGAIRDPQGQYSCESKEKRVAQALCVDRRLRGMRSVCGGLSLPSPGHGRTE